MWKVKVNMAPPPNILVTGTPGTGKSTFCKILERTIGLRHIEVGEFARERDLLHSYDEKLDCQYMHEDAVLDALEPIMTDGGVVLDHHSCDWFPERWIQLVVVLRASTHVLYDRLTDRKYSQHKLQENMEAEIMQVLLDEAKESYPKVKVMEMKNDDAAEQQANINQVCREYNSMTGSLGQQPEIM